MSSFSFCFILIKPFGGIGRKTRSDGLENKSKTEMGKGSVNIT